jgi:tocopherol O-methyltransferase
MPPKFSVHGLVGLLRHSHNNPTNSRNRNGPQPGNQAAAVPHEPQDQSLRRRVVAFYDRTDWMFRVLSVFRASPSMHAGLWDAGTRTHAAALATLNRELADRAGVEPGMRLLDVGCGAGSSVLWLADHRPVFAVGLSLVRRQVFQGARLAEHNRGPGLARFLCADYTWAALASATFDVVWSIESVCHASDKAALLAEAYRLLRPGGRLVIADRFRSGRPLPTTSEDLLRRWLGGWAMPDLFAAAELAEALERAEFADVVVEDVTRRAWPSLRFLGLFAAVSWPAALLLHTLGLQDDVQIAGIRGCIDQYRALRRGAFGYYLISATRPA